MYVVLIECVYVCMACVNEWLIDCMQVDTLTDSKVAAVAKHLKEKETELSAVN